MTLGYMTQICYHRGALIWQKIVHGFIFRSKIVIFIRYDGKKIRKFEIPAILKICMLSVIHGSNRHKKLS